MTLGSIETDTPGWSRRWFASMWKSMEAGVDETMSAAKDAVLTDLPDTVVDIGAGRGVNFARFGAGRHVIAIEPNRYMADAVREAARREGVDLDLRITGAEQIDLPDSSVDAVVSTLTLCSVDDPGAVVAEAQRVLRPGGRFLFVEHVAAPKGSWMRRVQSVLRLPWRTVSDGCDLKAETVSVIAQAGFSEVRSRTEGFGPKLDPSRLTYFGEAVK